jgi:citrate lyase subunit beta/citryl-CoA lyase
MKRIRSLLCVPAHRPELYEKAYRTDADCLMFDLEDSTPPQHKDEALATLVEYLNLGRTAPKIVAVRINPDRRWMGEVEALRSLCAILVVPKVQDVADLQRFNWFGGPAVLPVIETPLAIVNLRAILSLPGVIGGIFGIADFAAGMGVSDRQYGAYHDAGEVSSVRFAYAKQKLATYAAAYGKQALDTCFNVRHPGVVHAAWRWSRAIGFTGGAAIHPMQVPAANIFFGPSQEEQDWAMLTHVDHAARHGEVGVDARGLVVGLPVDRQAQAIIGSAR